MRTTTQIHHFMQVGGDPGTKKGTNASKMIKKKKMVVRKTYEEKEGNIFWMASYIEMTGAFIITLFSIYFGGKRMSDCNETFLRLLELHTSRTNGRRTWGRKEEEELCHGMRMT